MSTNQTYKINFKAQFDDLAKIKKELQSITENQEIQLKLGGQKNLILLQGSLKSLEDKLASSMDERGEMSLDSFKQVSVLMQNVLKMLQKFKIDLASATIPSTFVEQLEKIETKISNLKQANKELGSLKSNLSRKWNIEDGETSPSKSQKNRVVAETFDSDVLEPGTNRVINSYEQLEKIIQSLLQSNRQLTASEQQILNLWNSVQDSLKAGAQQAVDEWNRLNAQIEANRNEITALNNESKKLQLEGLNTSDTSSSIRDMVSAFTEITDTLSIDYTKALDLAEEAERARNKEGQNTGRHIGSNNNQFKQNTNIINENTKAVSKNQSALSKAVTNVVSYGTVLTLVRTVYTKLISTIKEMDKALTDMTVVTSLTREQAWGMTNQLANLAKTTGMTTTAIAEMTTKYLQQGKTLSDSIKLTEAAAKAARIAGVTGSESINLLTNAMNGFQISASRAMEVSDKFAALAASAATDYEELATALSKVAAQANLAGMSMDFTLGLLTKGIEVTREAPETIGTALKTVIARMRELTDYGATLEDGIDVNRVAKALDNIGVALLDDNRQFRDLEDVLTEVGEKWDKLNTNQQANVAVALAGTRQQSRLIAMMQDFDRTQELVNISMKSAGATAAQHRSYMQGLEAAVTNLTTSYQNLITSFTNSDVAIAVVNGLGDGLGYLADNMHIIWTILGALAIAFGPVIAQQAKLKAAQILSTIATQASSSAIAQNKVAEAERTKAIKETELASLELQLVEQEMLLTVAKRVMEEDRANAALAAKTVQTKLSEAATIKEALATAKNTKQLKLHALAIARLKKDKTAETRLNKELQEQENEIANLQSEQTKVAKELVDATDEQKKADKKYIESKQELVEQEQRIEETRLNMSQARFIIEQAQDLIRNAGKKKSFALTMQELMAQKMVQAGLKEGIAVELASNLVKNAGNVIQALKNIALRKEVATNKELLVTSLANIKATFAKATADVTATGTTWGLTGAMKALKTAIENIPIIGWIAAIIGLVIALIRAISETEAFASILDSFKRIGQSVMDILNAVFQVIGALINIIMRTLKPAIESTMFVINIVVGLTQLLTDILTGIIDVIVAVVDVVERFIGAIVSAIENIPILGDAIKWVKNAFSDVANFFGGAGDAIKNFFGGITSWLGQLFETAEDKSKRYAEEIAKNQEKIYKNSQLKSNLEPLIKEYELLSNKAVKSADDLARLQAIEDEIGQYNEAYIKDGQVQWDKVKKDVNKASTENEKLYKQNKDKAIQGINTGVMQGEFKTALSDFYTNEMLKDDDLTIVQQQAIQKSLETAFNNVDYNKIRAENFKAGFNSWLGLDSAYSSKSMSDIFDELGNSVISFNKVVYDEDAKLGDQLVSYAEHFVNLDETVKSTFASTFPYFEQMRQMAEKTGVSLTKFADKLGTLGLNANTYGELERAVKDSMVQGENESNEAFAKRQEKEWTQFFGNAIKKGTSKMDMVGLMLEEAVDENGNVNQSIVNAISNTLIKSNQAAIEDYTKKASSLDNIVELSLKAQEGTLTNDEIRTLFEENPDLFASAENVQKFLNGDTSFVADARTQNHNELKTALEEQKTFAEQQLVLNEKYNFLTEEQVDNLKMQINLTNVQMDNLKYQDLYSSNIWKNYANQTKEMQAQMRLSKELNKLEKQYSKLKTSEEKLDNIKQRSAIYAAEKERANDLLSSYKYTKLKEMGLEFIDGEVLLDSNKLKSKFGNNYASNQEYLDLLQWAEDNQQNIEDAQKVIEEYDDNMDEILDEYKSIIEEEYEKNIDTLEQEKELLEKRQEQYETYFDKMDALQEEQERAQSRNDIVAQLSALQGGSDSATSALRKDLLQQLADVTKEEEDARKQAARDALTESIEHHVENIDKSIDEWENKIDNLESMDVTQVFSILQGLGYNTDGYVVEYDNRDSSHGSIKDANGKQVLKFAQGGLVDYTGPAWVDGTKSKPEAFLSADQTAMVQQLVKGLEYNLDTRGYGNENTGNITVENINITTQQLNNDQDFRTAGQIFAEEFGKAIKQRGLNVNVRK